MLGEKSYAMSMRASIGDDESDLFVADTYEIPAAWNWKAAEENFTLSAGKHRLVVHNKDDGVKLDCIVLYREN